MKIREIVVPLVVMKLGNLSKVIQIEGQRQPSRETCKS